MGKQIDLSALRSQLESVVDEVADTDADYIVMRNGKPSVVLMSYAEFARWQRLKQDIRERFARTLERLDAHNAQYSEEEVAADVAEAIAEVRGQR